MIAMKSILIVVGILALVGAGLYVPLVLLQPSTTNGSTTCTTRNVTTSMSTTTFYQSTTLGSFSYSPDKPVKIDAVQAMVYQGTSGDKLVTFSVLFENVGTSPVYVVGGCGSGLTATLPTNSVVVQKVSGGPLCACAEFIAPLNPGQNHTSITPGCWSGYYYKLVHSGTVNVNFTLNWGTDGQNFQQSNSTTISATFTFS
jgi:hypothetical protein